MTRLLISVRDVHEARLAVAAGAGLIDFKEPKAGALGALDPALIKEGVAAVAGACETSATTGDDPDDAWRAAEAIIETGVDYVKVGLFGDGLRKAISKDGRALAGRTRLIGVLIADQEPDFELIPLMAEAGFAGAMLDVAGKGRSLPDVMKPARLEAFVQTCRTYQLMCGLAGSLRIGHVSDLAVLEPDLLGFRGGLCFGFDRTQALDPDLMKEAVETLNGLRR